LFIVLTFINIEADNSFNENGDENTLELEL